MYLSTNIYVNYDATDSEFSYRIGENGEWNELTTSLHTGTYTFFKLATCSFSIRLTCGGQSFTLDGSRGQILSPTGTIYLYVQEVNPPPSVGSITISGDSAMADVDAGWKARESVRESA